MKVSLCILFLIVSSLCLADNEKNEIEIDVRVLAKIMEKLDSLDEILKDKVSTKNFDKQNKEYAVEIEKLQTEKAYLKAQLKSLSTNIDGLKENIENLKKQVEKLHLEIFMNKNMVFGIDFNNKTVNTETNSIHKISKYGNFKFESKNDSDFYCSDFSNTNYLSISPPIQVGDKNTEYTFIVWYKGFQNNQNLVNHKMFHQPGVIIWGNNSGTGHIGLGIDGGKISITNRKKFKGTSNIADGKWHQLVFVEKSDNYWDAYVDGVKEIDNISAEVALSYQSIQCIGHGEKSYYPDITSPTLLDNIYVLKKALTEDQIKWIYSHDVTDFQAP